MSRHPDDPPLFYDLHVFCCTNVRPDEHARPSCGRAGASRIREHMKTRVKDLGLAGVRINAAACLDRCEVGPVVVIYPEGIWYRCASIADADLLIDRHLMAGDRVPALMLDREDREPA